MLRDLWDGYFKPFIATAIFTVILVAFAVFLAWLSTNPANASQARYQVAKSYIGLKEGTKAANKAMGVNTRAVPWCGHFVKRAVERSGGKPPKTYASGAGWTRFGKAVRLSQARKGDIVTVSSRYARSGRHVGIYSHRSNGKVCLISGNSRNSVRTSCYSASLVKAVRR